MNRVPRSSDKGASSVEYALLVGAIAAVLVIVLFSVGGLVRDIFASTCSSISVKTSSTAPTSEDCSGS